MDQLEQFFKKHKLRLTRPRREVFSALKDAEDPLFISELTTRLTGTDRTSIYRALELFHSIGVIEIIPTGFKKRYELAAPFAPHHHHLECEGCGQVISLASPSLESSISALAASHGFKLTGHHIELRGICLNCKNNL